MARRATLTFRLPDGPTEQTLVLDPDAETSIGRHPSCTITIGTPSVSRRHARIYGQGGGYYVEDLQSSNGTYINGQRIEKGSLADGDELRCGDFIMRFADQVEPGSGTREVGRDAAAAAAAANPAPMSAVPRMVGQLPRGARPKSLKPGGRIEADAPSGRPVPRPTMNGGAAAPAAAPAGLSDDARAEMAQLRAEVDALRADRDGIEMARADLERDLSDKARRIRDLESEDLRKGEQIKTLTDRSLRMREEVSAQQRQLEEYRVEKADLDYALAQAQQDANALRQTHEGSTRNEATLTDQINDLKREVRTRDKQLRESEQRLEVLEYDLKAAREDNENLRLAVGEDDSRRREANTTLEHLRQVLAEKESIIEQLQAELRMLRDRLVQAEATAREDAGVRAGRLEETLKAAEADRERLKARLDATSAALEDARQGSGNASREALEEIDRLKRGNRDLRVSLETVQTALEALQSAAPVLAAGGGADLDALQHRLGLIETERSDLEGQLALTRAAAREADQRARDAEGKIREAEIRAQRAESAAASASAATPAAAASAPAASGAASGGNAELVERTLALYQALNDLASELRNNIRLAVGCVDDVRAVGAIFDALPEDALPADTREKIEEADLAFTIENIGEMLGNAKNTAETFKRLMLNFRDFLSSQGLAD